MPTITKIAEQKRRANRRNVFLDGAFAFGCNVTVIARFRLREGMQLEASQIEAIQSGEVKQQCFDAAIRLIQSRLHSEMELRRKLTRQEWGETIVSAAIAELARMGYIDDEQFAKSKARAAAEHKHHGRRRAMLELMKAGVKSDVAKRALDEIYDQSDSTNVARSLAMKQAPRLQKLEPMVARRRLIGMLQRRGFDYESIKPIVEELLGRDRD